MNGFGYKQSVVTKAFELDGYYVWDTSVIKADGKYWMFSSRWKYEYGFGSNWLFNSEIILSCSDRPEGPFKFVKVVLPRRGKEFFDGMNTHNTCIKTYKNKFYLYYMGTTYEYKVATHANEISPEMTDSVWEHKRIGLAISDKIDGDYQRFDQPILDARKDKWDCTAITNPTVAILDDGTTYMLYKSRENMDYRTPMKLGITKAAKPEGPYERIIDGPICQYKDGKMAMEDPYLWFDKSRNKFCAIIKDCQWDGSGITGQYGDLFYAESNDCINFEINKNDALVATRDVIWNDGRKVKQCNLERPCILFDEAGNPEYLYCASGDGDSPYAFKGPTYIVCIKLEKKK